MVTRNYNCSQSQLYVIAEHAWQSATQYLTRLSTFKPCYTNAFIEGKLLSIAEARSLPPKSVRNAQVTSLRKKLIASNRRSLNDFKSLKLYIKGAFPADMHDIEFKAAGQQNFTDGIHRNWDSTELLLSMASNYLNAKYAQLMANYNMPDTFKAKLALNQQTFIEDHQNFLRAEILARISTEEKIKSNNKIYDDLQGLCGDARLIFHDSDPIRRRFTFSSLLKLVRGATVSHKESSAKE